ncbi:phage terminase large subunit family protein [Methylosinus sp. RM1]|uniref:phage terminase large subunit family protein n=1 Tax=Methylosinus sp. RM1 TaxID=2583817 RepID=UPI001FED7327|nr:phage terminase large subunit family protein [Methylosinus sp. RM1]
MTLDVETIRLVDEAWRRGLMPEPQLTVSEWADANRMLPTMNAEPGPWRTARVPYLREIMDALSTASTIERVVFMKGAQTGGTEAGLNAIGYWIAHAPGIILCVWPSLDMVRRNSRTRIEPLIDGTPALRSPIPQR